MERELTIYIPKPGTYAHNKIAKGSAIVGEDKGTDELMIYFEGGIYDQFDGYVPMLECAVGRLIEKYPTTAKLVVAKSDLIVIGAYWKNSEGISAMTIENEQAYNAWLAKGPGFDAVYRFWEQAAAFKAEGQVVGSWSLSSPEEMNEEAETNEYSPTALELHVYGERGLYREYFVTREMVEQGSFDGLGVFVVTYDDKKPLRIQALVPADPTAEGVTL